MELSFAKLFPVGVILLLLSIGISRADVPPVLTSPQAQSVRNGETGELICKFGGDASNCFWTKDGNLIDVRDRYVFMGDRGAGGDCSIRITESSLQYDDGIWECGIPGSSNSPGVKSDSAKYTVLTAPTSLAIALNSVELASGSDLLVPDFLAPPFVSCVSRGGNPGAQLQFQRNNENVAGSYGVYNESSSNNRTQTAVLNLTAVMDDSWEGAVLSCIATHQALNVSKVAYAYVHKPAAPTQVEAGADDIPQTTASFTLYSDTQEQLNLYCTANGYPPPESSAYRWDRRPTTSDSWSSFQNAQNLSFTAQEGQYSCVANTGEGTELRSPIVTVETSFVSASQTSLSLAEKPVVPQDASSTAQVGTIIAVVVVLIVLVIVTVGIVYMLYRKRKFCFKDNNEEVPPNPEQNGGEGTVTAIRMPDDTDKTKPEREGLMQDDLDKKNVDNNRTDASPKENGRTNGVKTPNKETIC